MRAVCCRVNHASVSVDNKIVGEIGPGLLVYIGVMVGDTQRDAQWIARKLPTLRLFNDQHDKMNNSTLDIAGSLLLIPNFTLAARAQKGNRPSYTDAALPDTAQPLFETVAQLCTDQLTTATGLFAAHMHINCQCDGPVTIILDSPKT